jgi:cell division protease FtsH
VDFEIVARGTPGLSGADLANLVNEAALLAARRNRDAVAVQDFDDAKDKIMLGMERKSVILSDEEARMTAYHEAGHALVAWLIPGADPIHKVTIIPRGHALGVTHLLPVDERHTVRKQHALDTLARALAGRAAEETAIGEITSGSAQDIDYATEIARWMVCNWGMSEALGPVSFGKEERQIFLGREMGRVKDYSEATAVLIDQEIRKLIDLALVRARTFLSENKDKLHLLAKALLERETLTGDEIDELFGKKPRSEPPRPGAADPRTSPPAAEAGAPTDPPRGG